MHEAQLFAGRLTNLSREVLFVIPQSYKLQGSRINQKLETIANELSIKLVIKY